MFRKKNKYHAKPTNGFPSKLESAVYDILFLREKMGEISNIKRQQTVVLQHGGKAKRIAIKIDFTFVKKATGVLWAAEAKGISTGEWRLKLKLWREVMPMPLELWKGDYRRPKLVEIIEAAPDEDKND